MFINTEELIEALETPSDDTTPLEEYLKTFLPESDIGTLVSTLDPTKSPACVLVLTDLPGGGVNVNLKAIAFSQLQQEALDKTTVH